MHSAMNEASTRLLTQMFMFNSTDPGTSQFLQLHVSRHNIVQDALRELSNYSERDFKKPLKVPLNLCQIMHVYILWSMISTNCAPPLPSHLNMW